MNHLFHSSADAQELHPSSDRDRMNEWMLPAPSSSLFILSSDPPSPFGDGLTRSPHQCARVLARALSLPSPSNFATSSTIEVAGGGRHHLNQQHQQSPSPQSPRSPRRRRTCKFIEYISTFSTHIRSAFPLLHPLPSSFSFLHHLS